MPVKVMKLSIESIVGRVRLKGKQLGFQYGDDLIEEVPTSRNGLQTNASHVTLADFSAKVDTTISHRMRDEVLGAE